MENIKRDPMIRLYDLFKAADVPVYFPNQHNGHVKFPLVVLADMGNYATRSGRLNQNRIHVIIHVPQDKYTDILKFSKYVESIMECVRNDYRPTGFKTPVINDDTRRSYTTSLEYIVHRSKIKKKEE